ncbi:RNA polymerase, sigma-24 subunit, ECF subfamily [Catenulispora acidiphila DSM 44928]|uniref:RNA polymerase, sigma-24 subunit, ECF subfamily n=1 Tax=Catenulispora acidiphila (strain DSM 44928 / JCM 14897 / NBRC 102108 / NRRL B-24433 / ID139908) TaxID=479433 RepID=C7Q029_CATAD|nr:SigE family RNA polymerase sigma factor [Catenulispora acidiphila]ACU75522.1 RNA polymerase, sigma-24 subunit, ECF subfamily [Catenulispora acidiphila DSM 44928]
MGVVDQKDRDESEFQGFVLARRRALMRTAYLLTGDTGRAEDLVQTALAKAYVAWRRVRDVDDPSAYVARILINAHTSEQRRKRVREWFPGTVPEPAVSDRAEAVADRSALMAALATLAPRQRAVVVLRFWEDRSENDVAHLLGCSIGTVRSQAFRGLAKLRASPELSRLFEHSKVTEGLGR